MICPCCDSEMRVASAEWQYICSRCRYRCSSLATSIGEPATAHRLDETHRELALGGLRRRNFETVLDRMAPWAGGRLGLSLLDVGCAHGWFLDAAARRGFVVAGVEPEAGISEQARRRGHTVFTGFFPESVPRGAQYDVITFHDVFEHLPDVAGASEACRALLRDNGLLVINLPSSAGVFFRVAELLAALGIRGFRDRMWQKGFPSPHLSYFRPSALALLMGRHGFDESQRGALPATDRRGLWQRLRYDRDASLVTSCAVWLAVMAASPFLQMLPADISLQIFIKRA